MTFGRVGINGYMIMASEKFVVKWIHGKTNSQSFNDLRWNTTIKITSNLVLKRSLQLPQVYRRTFKEPFCRIIFCIILVCEKSLSWILWMMALYYYMKLDVLEDFPLPCLYQEYGGENVCPSRRRKSPCCDSCKWCRCDSFQSTENRGWKKSKMLYLCSLK